MDGNFRLSGQSRIGTRQAEVIRPVAYFLSKFIKPPDDYASVIAFDIRPTPITDFTNDPNRLRQTVDLLLQKFIRRFVKIIFSMRSNSRLSAAAAIRSCWKIPRKKSAEYGGMVDVKAKRRAIILVASGIDTFSKTNYDAVRKDHSKLGHPDLCHQHRKSFSTKCMKTELPATDSESTERPAD